MSATAFVVILATVVTATTATAVTAADPPPAPSDRDRFYVALFGGQGDVLRPRTAHTWAAFVRTTPAAGGDRVAAADAISWLPATLRVRPLARDAEPGVNLTLEQTLAHVAGGPRARVTVFGPFEISEAAYQQAVAQKKLLESGAVRYHSLGLHGRRADVMHCVDAITRMDAGWEAAATPSRWYGQVGTGQAGRAAVATGVVADPAVTHPWVLRELNPLGYRLLPRPLVTHPATRR